MLVQENVNLVEDLQFVSQGKSSLVDTVIISCLCCNCAALQTANDEYSKKVQSEGTQEKTLIDLAWKLDDLPRLSQNGRTLLVDDTTKIQLLEDQTTDFVSANIPWQWTQVCEQLIMFVKGRLRSNILCINLLCPGLYRQLRTAASHCPGC